VLFVVLVASPHFVDESTSRSTKRVACPNFEDSSIHVNIHVLEGLSFTEAKYIDLIWDTGIGQVGRFLHGLVLHHLVSRVLTTLLEHSALPYYFYLQVIFDPVAVKSLWSCLRILLAKKPVPTTVMVIGIFFAISHVLAFATIWSAATGYEFDTATAYAITDTDSFISMASGQLTLCWSVPDWDRVQKGVGNKIIIGPTIEQIYGGNWEKIGSRLEFNEDSIIQEASGDFKNIYACKTPSSYVSDGSSIDHRFTRRACQSNLLQSIQYFMDFGFDAMDLRFWKQLMVY
jgi:hypothetical protein